MPISLRYRPIESFMSVRSNRWRASRIPGPRVSDDTHEAGHAISQYAPGVVSDARLVDRILLYGPRTALLVVDVQNDFADPSGSLYVPGGRGCRRRTPNAEIAAGPRRRRQDRLHAGLAPARDAALRRPTAASGRSTASAAPGARTFHPDLVVAGEVVQKGTGGEDGYSGVHRARPRIGPRAADRAWSRCCAAAGVTERRRRRPGHRLLRARQRPRRAAAWASHTAVLARAAPAPSTSRPVTATGPSSAWRRRAPTCVTRW